MLQGFAAPTPIQEACLMPAIRGRRDIIGAAQTVGTVLLPEAYSSAGTPNPLHIACRQICCPMLTYCNPGRASPARVLDCLVHAAAADWCHCAGSPYLSSFCHQPWAIKARTSLHWLTCWVLQCCHVHSQLPRGLALHMGTAAHVAVSCAGVLSAPPAAPRTRQHQPGKGFMVQLWAAVPATHPQLSPMALTFSTLCRTPSIRAGLAAAALP
jgi:hypothetical protein